MKPRLIIGLTGGIGSGKTTVSGLFAEQGVAVIDADVAAREVTAPGQAAVQEIAVEFGAELVDGAGELDRAKLREIVFASAEKRGRLEGILHPRISAQMDEQLAQARGPYCVLCVPLLFETGRDYGVDRVLVVDAPEALQIERALQRDGSSRATIEGILGAQINRHERLARADDVIDNDSDLFSLRGRVAALHQDYLEVAAALPADRG